MQAHAQTTRLFGNRFFSKRHAFSPFSRKNQQNLRTNSQKHLFYFSFFVERVLAVKRAIFVQLQFALNVLAVFVSSIISALAFAALQRDDFHRSFFLACHKKLLENSNQAFQSPRAGSNRRPQPYHGCALPAELQGRKRKTKRRDSAPIFSVL